MPSGESDDACFPPGRLSIPWLPHHKAGHHSQSKEFLESCWSSIYAGIPKRSREGRRTRWRHKHGESSQSLFHSEHLRVKSSYDLFYVNLQSSRSAAVMRACSGRRQLWWWSVYLTTCSALVTECMLNIIWGPKTDPWHYSWENQSWQSACTETKPRH